MERDSKIRIVHFFGYGADREPDLIEAVIGYKPLVLGPAILNDYQLRIQSIREITDKGHNPRKILQGAWGNDFKSYIIMPKEGAVTSGHCSGSDWKTGTILMNGSSRTWDGLRKYL